MIHTFPPVLAEITTEREFLFHSPGWLWVLIPLALLFFLRRKRGTACSVKHPGLRMVAGMARKPRRLAGRIGPILMVLSAMALVVALARPQWRNRHEEQKVSGIDIMVTVDLSPSMAITDMDMVDQDEYGRTRRRRISRITAAKQVVTDFIEGRPNDRIGLVAFSGKAKLCSPLTLDHGILLQILDHFFLAWQEGFTIHPGYIKEDGTAIGTAIATSATRLQSRKETKSKVIILVTDGVSNRGKITPTNAARLAADMNIKIFTIGIGDGKPLSAHTAQMDTLDEKTLRKIASLTHGQYYRAKSGESLQEAFSSIDQLEKTEAKRRVFMSYVELFPYPLAVAACLLLLGSLLTFVRPRPAP